MPKTTRNLLGLFSMNTYSSGKQYGNPLGDGSAVMPLQTTVHGVYHFNFHYSLPELDSRGEKRAGHTVILGATGAGKTTLQTTLLTFLGRLDNKLFAVDKDGSMRGFIEAVGDVLQAGQRRAYGLESFQLPDTPQNRNFLYDLVGACGRKAGQEGTAEDTKDIKRAVDNVFELPFEQRRFGCCCKASPTVAKTAWLAAWLTGAMARWTDAMPTPWTTRKTTSIGRGSSALVSTCRISSWLAIQPLSQFWLTCSTSRP